jgi:EpsI family protein
LGDGVIARALLVIAVVATMRIYTAHADSDRPAPRASLSRVPLQIGEWRGWDEPTLTAEVIEAAGVDDYLNRVYTAGSRHAVALYIGYYATQRQGDSIHSPQNCLPGAGWQPIATTRTSFSFGPRRFEANQVLIQKGLDRAAVIYWYQGRGRLVAGEYANKLWLMLDAARLHRTDGGLVRIIAPLTADSASGLVDAVSFAQMLVPHLTEELP